MKLDISQIGKLISPFTLSIKKEKVNSKNILAHSKLYGYTLYNVYDVTFDAVSKEKFTGYGIVESDFERFYPGIISDISYYAISKDSVKDNRVFDKDSVVKMVEITPSIVNKIKNIKSTSIELYILKRCFFPDDEDIKKVTKKIEFETLYQLFLRLYDICIFKGQIEFLGYRIDCLAELKYISDWNIPNIYIEIDEDGHLNYSSEKEIARQKFIESFRNKVVRVKVNRKDKDINKILDDTEVKVRGLFKELIIENTPEMTIEGFLEFIGDNSNIDRELVGMFFKNESIDPVYKYTHMEVGELLGYVEGKDNYEKLRKSIKEFLTKDIDYRIATKEEVKKMNPCEFAGIHLDALGREIKGGKTKQIILLNRLGVYLTALSVQKINSKIQQFRINFAKVYEKTIQFCDKLRYGLIKNLPKPNENLTIIKDKIDHEVQKKYNVKKTLKLETELREIKEQYDILSKELEECKKMIKEKDRIINDQEKQLTVYRARKYTEEQTKKVKNSGTFKVSETFYTKEKLNKLTIVDIKNLCKDLNIKNYSGKNKEVLIEYVLSEIKTQLKG